VKPGGKRSSGPVGDDMARALSWNEGHSMDTAQQLWRFMRVRKKFWLMPVFGMLALFGTLFVLTQGSAVAPFIYTLF
jgi:hypothetical protein